MLRGVTLVEGSSPAGTSLKPAAVQFSLGRWSLSLSLRQPATAVTIVTWERRKKRMKSCILAKTVSCWQPESEWRKYTYQEVSAVCVVWLTAAEAGSVIRLGAQLLVCWYLFLGHGLNVWGFLLPLDTNVDDDVQKNCDTDRVLMNVSQNWIQWERPALLSFTQWPLTVL